MLPIQYLPSYANKTAVNRACTLFCILIISTLQLLTAQDTLLIKDLDEVKIIGQSSNIQRLPQVQGTYIWSGKKNEVIQLLLADVNIAEKTPRQIFAKIPGVFVYDMDGTGNQMNISTRGLDPHRGWEFNLRKNGIITNSDMYGYPASHYSMPMEAVERIELVRGTGALQYGAQFGGMLNYVVKQPDTARAISLESINSLGSFGLLSTYNAIGGKVGKLEYYAYYSKRVSDGYRDGSRNDFDGQSAILKYVPNDRLTLTAEFARSRYVYQTPGPLTDAMFRENPRQATRSRNYFSPEIYVPSISADWQLGTDTRLSWTVSAVLGQRGSVMYDRPATVADSIDSATLTFAKRQVDIDNYHSYTSELRLLHGYKLGKLRSIVAAGVQYFNNDLHRRQLGKGTSGSDFDLSLSEPGWGRDLRLKTQNIAFFAENLIQITPALSISPGVRVESGSSRMSGIITYLPEDEIPNTIEHRFPLFGVNVNYDLHERQNLYAGWSQAYRPVIFKDIIPGSIFERADKNLRNAQGYNMEAGYRGTVGSFRWDLSVFRLQYNDRLGNQALGEGNDFIIFRTNIGHSLTHGVEAFGEYAFRLFDALRCNVFTSTAWMDAKYQDASIRTGNENTDVSGNKVESVPAWISRNGLNVKYKRYSLTALYSYTGESFADPLNTVAPSATGAVGLVPAYGLVDLNASCRISTKAMVRLSINNLADNQYFTKRPTFYPGPGIWPSDGRSAVLTVGVKI